MSTPPDFPFDLEDIRLTQDFAAALGVKKALTTVPVRRPDRQWFVRVHPDPAFRLETAVFELKEDGETFLVAPNMVGELAGEVVPKLLLTAVTRQKNLFLWPVRMPNELGRLDEWNRSALEAAKLAERQWIRMAANRSLGAYETFVATGDLPEPEWPDDKTFWDLVKIAFKGRVIDTIEHQVVKRLRGIP